MEEGKNLNFRSFEIVDHDGYGGVNLLGRFKIPEIVLQRLWPRKRVTPRANCNCSSRDKRRG